jgi:transcriptional regulator with XRE-family HTH domain
MLNLHQIQQAIQDRRLGIVAEATGISRATLWAIREGKNTNPSHTTLKAISDYLEGAK